MPLIRHDDLDRQCLNRPLDPGLQVFLIAGDDYLCNQAFSRVVDALVPADKRALCYSLLEGDDAAVPALIERLSTYSFLTDRLVLAVKHAPLFQTASASGSYSKDDLDQLESAIKRTFPEGHFLVLTTGTLDRRRSLVKTVSECGVVVDCTVPSGNRQADQNEKNRILAEIRDRVLAGSEKSMSQDTFRLLLDQTGFDPASLDESLQRLVAFTGDRKAITSEDVSKVVAKTRSEALYEFTNAVAEKKLPDALTILASLLKEGFHPLQLMAALTNQVRKLCSVQAFIDSDDENPKRSWVPGMDYNMFRNRTFPAVLAFDAGLKQTLEESIDFTASGAGQERTAKKAASDLFIAPNAKNPYPVYHTFLRVRNFTAAELTILLGEISRVDHLMKSSGGDPVLLLENLVTRMCSPGAIHETKN